MDHVCCIIFGDIRFDSRSSKFLQTLSSNGFRSTAIISPEPSDTPYPQSVEVVPIIIPQAFPLKLRLLIFYVRAFIAALGSHATIYLASELYTLPVAWMASVCTRRKLVYDSRELYSAIAALHHRPIIQRFWSFCERVCSGRVASMITVNESIAVILGKEYPRHRIHVVRNIPASTSTPDGGSVLRQELGIGMETKIVLYQGGLQEGRGIRLLLSVAKNFPGVAFVFLGNGPLSRDIEESSRQNGYIRHIDAVPLPLLPAMTAGADVGCCLIENFGLSYYYSLPNKLFEYVTAGVPVLGSSFPEIEGVIAGMGVGLVADPNNADAVANAMRRLLSDPALAERCRVQCRAAARRLSWENESLLLLKAFTSI